ncbi:MAG: AAA family ATPase [Burkholderiales bacterium]|jgi:ABC-type ATPase involved in cell division|nr:AAA family ATPase [Burkholderiales bacterium]
MTRRLAALRVGNFKAFAETQRIPLKPITLIFGPNSAGKSSFIHSLALAHEAHRKGLLDVFRTELGGTSIDLGGFRQYVHKTDRGNRVEWAAELDVAQMPPALAGRMANTKRVTVSLLFGLEGELDLDELMGETSVYSDKLDKESDSKVVVMYYELLADGQSLAKMSRRRDGTLRLDSLDRDHPVFRQVIDAIIEVSTAQNPDSARAILVEAVDALVPEISAQVINFLPKINLPERDGGLIADAMLQPISRDNRADDLANAAQLFFPRALSDIVNGLNDLVREELDTLVYLGPLRSFPPRHMAFAEHDDKNWKAGGGYAWDVVRADKAVRDAVNTWLGSPIMKTPYRLAVRTLFALDQMASPLATELDELAERMNVMPNPDADIGYSAEIDNSDKEARQILQAMRKSNVDRVTELALVDERTKTVVSHRDVGIGISQVLPVLVTAFASRNRIVAMEQPEIHLHPALQAELADVFLESALGERQNTFVLETHSEHLVLRLLRRIRETADGELPEGMQSIRPEDICIVYVQPGQKGSSVVEIPVTSDGDFSGSWPEGFFAERAKELF